MRIGFGYDVHRLVEGRKLMIGGIEIPSEKGLAGHSDADVLLHAIGDALLGAAALGDLGAHFPDTDARWKDVDSRVLLAEILRLLSEAGYQAHNVDATVVLEKPKLRPHIDRIRSLIAQCLALPKDAVSVKATTNEMMDSIGSGEGASAYAVCLIKPSDRAS